MITGFPFWANYPYKMTQFPWYINHWFYDQGCAFKNLFLISCWLYDVLKSHILFQNKQKSAWKSNLTACDVI